jgi:hypothetical protein
LRRDLVFLNLVRAKHDGVVVSGCVGTDDVLGGGELRKTYRGDLVVCLNAEGANGVVRALTLKAEVSEGLKNERERKEEGREQMDDGKC